MNCDNHRHHIQSNSIHYSKDSLLKYESPRLITNHDLSKMDYKKICRATLLPSSQSILFVDENLNIQDPYSNLCRPADILDFIFPPIELFNKTNHKYIVCVSRHPASKNDVYNLERNLNFRLKQAQALEIGLCPRRRQIYDECFDELIRQVTIECSERGILLSRIRQTYQQLMNDYLNNYISANAYAMRTLLVNEETKKKLQEKILHLENDIKLIKNQLINTEDYYENLMKLYSRFQSNNEYRYQTINTTIPLELQQLRIVNNSLKQDLENLLMKKLNKIQGK